MINESPQHMTLSETEAALESVDTQMKLLEERRARLRRHRNTLGSAPADISRWGAAFPWTKEVDRLKKEYAVSIT